MRTSSAYGWNNEAVAWDSNRSVPWGRLSREWLVYAVVMIFAFAVFLRDSVSAGSILGLAASYPLYMMFGGFLAKMGYQRKTLRDIRTQAREVRTPPPSNEPRRPAPTKRTSTGPSQHRKKKR